MLSFYTHLEQLRHIYYKPTNSHDYLDFNSHHPIHIKKNIPFVLAKRIMIFTSNSEKEASHLLELKHWLRNCNYPVKIIKKGFRNARMQGPAPLPNSDIILPLVTTYYSNYNLNHLAKSSSRLLKYSRDERVKEVFGNREIVLSHKQPQNILRHLSTSSFKSQMTDPKENGLFKCTDKRCVLCKHYIQECKSFMTSNNVIWELRTRITCNSKNVIYYLKCISCDFNETYTGKTNNLRLRMNNHIIGCRYGNSSDRFDIHVYNCRLEQGLMTEPHFQIYAFIKLKHEKQLLTYESYFHSKGFDTMN